MDQPRLLSCPSRGRVAIVLLTTAAALTLQVDNPAPAAAAISVTTARTQVDSLTDTARKNAGCQPLTLDSRLNLSAQRHADDMAAKKYFSHTSKDGTTWYMRIKQAGYPSPGGENIAWSFTTSSAVMQAWMNSSGHRRNILNCSFKRIGVGYNPNGHYWVQDFGY